MAFPGCHDSDDVSECHCLYYNMIIVIITMAFIQIIAFNSYLDTLVKP